jgi:uracil-DNA glycosylase
MISSDILKTEDVQFHNYLRRIFGSRMDHFSVKKDDGIHLLLKPLNDTEIITNPEGKCSSCLATDYRQDIPFWLGSHRNKKAVVISQDAGKGKEIGSINCVFSLQIAANSSDDYISKHHTHKHYLELFSKMLGEDFLKTTYFTDIIKCAYSSDPKISINSCKCKNDIFGEIRTVSPKIVILIGSPAKNSFVQLSKENGFLCEEIFRDSVQYNKKASLNFIEYHFDNKTSVFSIPHFVGDLRVGKDFKSGVKDFEIQVCERIRNKQEN